ncbi:MAG: Peptidase protein [Acidobacteriota bacterium]|nr:Peptidase protein [Acidobacteriota bacterium]
MHARTAAFAAMFALATAGLAADSALLSSIDPLQLPPPTLAERMTFAPDWRTPAEKVHPTLWEEALARGSEAVIPVIMTLQEPLLPERHRVPAAAADAYRVQSVAALAHEFAALAQARGVSGIRALSHFPVLFGEVHARDLVRLAGIQQLRTVRKDETRHAMRVQGGALMNATNLRNLHGGSGAGRGVAIFDTGVDVAHPEFAGRAYVAGNYSGSPGNGDTDVDGHGTACAGISLGSSGGMAPLAKLWTLKVLDDDGSGSDSAILSALNAVYAARAQFGGVHALSLSLGGGGPHNSDCDALLPDYAAVFNAFVAAGVPVFVASGNEEFLNGIAEPACLSAAISVGAVSDSAGVVDPACPGTYPAPDRILCYSNSGIPLDILAPSACASTTAPGGAYTSCFNGTSAATPYAAGVAAQILSLLPTTTAAQLKNSLMSTGLPITDLNGITRSRIDAVQAYQTLAGGGADACVPGPTTACLLSGRFKVEIEWTDFLAVTRDAFVASAGTSDSALFYWTNPNNWEVLIKAINACSLNNKFWIYFAAATNVGYRVTVTDTVAGGAPKVYLNAVGNLAQATNDINAFDCP